MFLMEKLGPLSSVFVHFTFMRRSFPLASHGLVKEPIPLEFAGQSWCCSGAALAAVLAAALALALAVAEAAADGVTGALALAAGVRGLGSALEKPGTRIATG